jgi:hypothetical protein
MNTPHDPVDRLLQLAKEAGERPVPSEPPFGFATRVLAAIRGERQRSAWETLALRSLPVAALITVACLLLGAPRREQPAEPQAIAQTMIELQVTATP